MPADETLMWRANPVSAANMFASAANYNHVYRTRWLRRKRPGVTQANALLTVYTPLHYGTGSVLIGKADCFEESLTTVSKISENERRISLATSAGGAIAAPGLMYMAVRSAKNNEGGVPRAMARLAGTNKHTKNTKAGKKLKRLADKLDSPKSLRWKRAALAAGAGGVALQGLNSLGDSITARAMS
jgi:hypothetical protein